MSHRRGEKLGHHEEESGCLKKEIHQDDKSSIYEASEIN
jgi:hypothetical protein